MFMIDFGINLEKTPVWMKSKHGRIWPICAKVFNFVRRAEIMLAKPADREIVRGMGRIFLSLNSFVIEKAWRGHRGNEREAWRPHKSA